MVAFLALARFVAGASARLRFRAAIQIDDACGVETSRGLIGPFILASTSSRNASRPWPERSGSGPTTRTLQLCRLIVRGMKERFRRLFTEACAAKAAGSQDGVYCYPRERWMRFERFRRAYAIAVHETTPTCAR